MVLSLVWYKVLPPQFGGQKGIALFSRYLAEHMPLTLLCSDNNIPDKPLNYHLRPLLPVSKWQFISPAVWKKISREQEAVKAEVLLLEHCYYGLTGWWLHQKTGIPVVVHSHNIEYQRFRQQGKWWWPVLFLLERFTHRHAQLNLFKTPRDLQTAIDRFQLDPAKCMVIPYGLEDSYVPDPGTRRAARAELGARHGIGNGQKIILFNGTLDYAPNAEAVEHLVKKILPLLEDVYTVVVCGRLVDPKFKKIIELKAERFVFAGFVEDIQRYFQGADIFLNPVTTGGGVKVKVMEALSYGLPVVSYISGATGIDQEFTGGMLVTVKDQDASAMALAVHQVQYGNTIPPSFIQHYHWRQITRELAKRIQQLGVE